jgi:hypothetical protein
VVDEPVDHGGGDDVVAEDLAPAIWDAHRFRCLEIRSDVVILPFSVPDGLRGERVIC